MGKAAGYQNLPSGNWAPAIYSQKVLKYFRRASVVEAITNTDYTGEIENFGDTVNILKRTNSYCCILCTRTNCEYTDSCRRSDYTDC